MSSNIHRALSGGARLATEAVRAVLARRRCAACDRSLAADAAFCGACAAALEPPPRSEWVAFGLFGGPLADALRTFKYRDRPDLARPLGSLLRRGLEDSGLAVDVVVPVPLHPRRLGERGYNQSALLAYELGLEVRHALRRVRPTEAQARLGAEDRLANVRGAFEQAAPLPAGARVLLVDDVCTTGATLGECRRALSDSGVDIVGAAVAIAPRAST